LGLRSYRHDFWGNWNRVLTFAFFSINWVSLGFRFLFEFEICLDLISFFQRRLLLLRF
jgi:hypothetical protein